MLSIVISGFILLLLLRMKNKDISIHLRAQLILYDIVMEIVNIFAFDYVMSVDEQYFPLWYSALIMSLLLFTRTLHTLLIMTIAWCLYCIIVRQDISIKSKLGKFTLITNTIAGLVVLLYNIVYLSTNSLSNHDLMNIENMFFLLPAPIILIFLAYLYIKIRKTLKNELESQSQLSCCKRIFAKHLIAYPLNYSFMVFLSILIVINLLTQNKGAIKTLFIVADFLFYVLYPILNSVLYGITKSTKKFMCAFLLRDKSYQEEEEILKILRDTNLLREQYYLDLISRTEEFDYI